MENMKSPQKNKNRSTIWTNNPTSVYISKISENGISERCVYSILYSQDVETICLSQWING